MLKRVTIGLICLLLCCMNLALATENEGVDDAAGVLSAATAKDLASLNETLETNTGLRIALVTKHFLGGKNKNTYAREMLNRLSKGNETILLIMIIGEEDYCIASGQEAQKIISKEMADTLLAKYFRAPYLQRNYDEAVGNLMIKLTEQVSVKLNKTIKIKDRFRFSSGLAVPENEPTKQISKQTNNLNSFFSSSDQSQYKGEEKDDEEESNLLNVLIFFAVFYFIFYKKKNSRMNPGCGCGCSPFHSLFALFGLSKLFGMRK